MNLSWGKEIRFCQTAALQYEPCHLALQRAACPGTVLKQAASAVQQCLLQNSADTSERCCLITLLSLWTVP